MIRFAPLGLFLTLSAPLRPEPGCEAQTTSAKPIALATSMSFPPLASRFNVQGSVVISATIDSGGRVVDTRIESSEPAGTFDETAKREYHPGVPAPIVGARELYAIEGEITRQANVSRLPRF